MVFEIRNDAPISELQKAFSGEFRWLKLAFFTKPHGVYKGSNAKFLITDTFKTFGEIRERQNEGRIFLEPSMPVWQVERLFEEDFGLHVQVHRKSGGLWLETSVTDDLTLEAQDAKGRESEEMARPVAEPLDYREQD